MKYGLHFVKFHVRFYLGLFQKWRNAAALIVLTLIRPCQYVLNEPMFHRFSLLKANNRFYEYFSNIVHCVYFH